MTVWSKPGQMILRQPVAQARWQQQLLITITRNEVLGHDGIVRSDPDGGRSWQLAPATMETPARPPLIVALADWAREPQTLTPAARPSYREDGSRGTWSATVDGEAPQRVGYLTVWESGVCDFQVLRRADEFLVLNEHRLLRTTDELLDALAAFRLVLIYHDPRE